MTEIKKKADILEFLRADPNDLEQSRNALDEVSQATCFDIEWAANIAYGPDWREWLKNGGRGNDEDLGG